MNTPTFDPDDPRLTAYALGESSSAAEREGIEALLAVSPDARSLVEETRALARALEEDFALENYQYQQAHAPMAIPANVIPFPGPARRWKTVAVLGGAVAAVLAALLTLVLPAIRGTNPAPTVAGQPATPPVATEASPLPPVGSDASADARLLIAEATPPPPRAEAAEEPADKARDTAADGAAEPRVRADKLATLRPGATRAAPAAAAPLAMAPPPPASGAAAATVRVRLGKKSFTGGVLLTADGRVLTAQDIPVAGSGVTLDVLLTDGRSFPAEVLTADRQLKIKATGLPHVSFAAERPAAGNVLEIARIDEHDGTLSFVRTRADEVGSRIADGGTFVFNAAGELLACEPATVAAKATSQARAAVRREQTAPWTVRPFTAAERAALTGSEK